MHTLAERYAPLGEETRLRAMTDLFNFDRRSGESVDDLLTRFDITRTVATNEGGVGLDVRALTWYLLKCDVRNLFQVVSFQHSGHHISVNPSFSFLS